MIEIEGIDGCGKTTAFDGFCRSSPTASGKSDGQ